MHNNVWEEMIMKYKVMCKRTEYVVKQRVRET